MISIVVFTRDDAEWLERCLGSLTAEPPAEDYEVIVFDNCSRDDSAERVRAWRGAGGERASLIQAQRDTSFSEGNNLGLRAAAGDLVLFLNPDTEPRGHILDACAATLRSQGDVGLVGPCLRFPSGAGQANGWALPTVGQLVAEKLGRAARHARPTGEQTDVGWLMGCFLMGRRADLSAIGGFDERFWFHGTDLELCARVGDEGWRVTRLEGVELVHRGHADWSLARRRASWRATAQWLWSRR